MTVTPYKTVLTTLRERFYSEWDNRTTVVFDNEAVSSPALDKPWTRFLVRPSETRRVAFGDAGRERKLGILVGDIFVPKQSLDAEVYDLADTFATIFRSWRSVDGVIKCDGATRLNTIDNDPNWFRVSVTIEWECEG